MVAYRNGGRAWGDEEDDDYLPPTEISGPDESGIKTVVEYKIVDGQRMKITKKIKVTKHQVKVSKRVEERKKWALHKFGDAAEEPQGPNPSHTSVSFDEIIIEDPNISPEQQAKAEEEALKKRIKESAIKRQLSKRLEDQGLQSMTGLNAGVKPGSMGYGLRTGTAQSEANAPPSDVATASNSARGLGISSSGKYVPPSMRAGASGVAGRHRFGLGAGTGGGGDGEEQITTLRVSNITTDTTEQDLNRLCSQYGSVQRVFLAKDKETGLSRGFAYVSFVRKDDAERALTHLHGAGFDHLILNVEWAKPSKKSDVGNENILSRGYATGYGKALPQGAGLDKK